MYIYKFRIMICRWIINIIPWTFSSCSVSNDVCIAFTNICEILYIYPIKLFLQMQGITCEIGKPNIARFISQVPSFFCWCNSPPVGQGFIHEVSRSTYHSEWLAETSTRRHTTCTRQISMPPGGFELTFSGDERSQTYAFDRAAFGTGTVTFWCR